MPVEPFTGTSAGTHTNSSHTYKPHSITGFAAQDGKHACPKEMHFGFLISEWWMRDVSHPLLISSGEKAQNKAALKILTQSCAVLPPSFNNISTSLEKKFIF